MCPSGVITAAAVSSQDVSMPRIISRCSLVPRPPCPRSSLVFDALRGLLLGRRCRIGVTPHDHCIFFVVSIVTASDATRDEAKALVEGDCGEVRNAYLQRVAALGVVAGHLEQPRKHGRRDPVPPVLRIDRDVHHVPRIDVPRQHQIPDELLVGRHGSDREGALLRELAGEHRARPGRRVRGPFDSLDRIQVAELEPAQREGHATHLLASGSRTYTGSTSSAGPNAVASDAWRAARGTCSTESAAGTSAPRATSRSRYRQAPSPTRTLAGGNTSSCGLTASGPGTKTSPRRASMTGNAPSAPAASAASVETPATGRSSESARPRATARPILVPVKLPGPVPTTMPVTSPGTTPASTSSSSTSARSDCGRVVRSPRVTPSATSALVARSVAV